MTPLAVLLLRAARLLEEILPELEARVRQQDPAALSLYLEAVRAAAELDRRLTPGADGQLLTTAQLAHRLQVSTKTVRRRAKNGELQPVRLGERGRGALRWPAHGGQR